MVVSEVQETPISQPKALSVARLSLSTSQPDNVQPPKGSSLGLQAPRDQTNSRLIVFNDNE